jgi:site-specific DNA recombinase
MRAAIYARVSTGRQERDQTIEGQLTALRHWAQAHGHGLRPEHVFTDEGYSGARLDRPGLDRLRDAAREGEFDVLAVLSPDRLARKYAYQVLLLEEFRKAGCEVVFVQRPVTDDPHDQLLLQIQGAVAEYERAVLGERFRRGKLQKARAGLWVAGRAPYGYRYVPKRDGVPGHLVVDEAEADVVRMLCRWLIDEQMTVRQILKRLAAGPWRPRCGRRLWSAAVVHRILSDPAYTGTAYVNRYAFAPPRRPRSRGPRTYENTCRRPRPREEWVAVPVPAIIDEPTHQHALAQLRRNSVLSFRNNTRNDYLLRCLLTCRTCGLAMFGITHHATDRRPQYRYYQCHGKDCVARDRERRCPRRPVKAEELDAAVWGHVQQLLRDPETLLAQFEAFARQADDGAADSRAAGQKWEARLRQLDREEQRLLDAYQAEVIDLRELKERRAQVAARRQVLAAQGEQQARLQAERRTAQEVWGDLKAFCERVRSRLEEATLAEKQRLLQLLIERVIVGEDTPEIRHVIPLRRLKPAALAPAPPDGPAEGAGPAGASPEAAEERLRSDGVGPAHLPLQQGHVVVGPPAVAAQDAAQGRTDQLTQGGHVPQQVDEEHRHGLRGRHPQPALAAGLLPAGLIGVLDRRLPHRLQGLLVGRRQRRADLLLQVGDRPQRHRGVEDGLGDFLHAALTEAVAADQVRQHRGQAGPDAVGADLGREGGPRDGTAAGTGAGVPLILGDPGGQPGQLRDLVARRRRVVGTRLLGQGRLAVCARRRHVGHRPVDALGGHQLLEVGRVARLPARPAAGGLLGRPRRQRGRRARWGLGPAQPLDEGLQLRHAGFQGGNALVALAASGTVRHTHDVMLAAARQRSGASSLRYGERL